MTERIRPMRRTRPWRRRFCGQAIDDLAQDALMARPDLSPWRTGGRTDEAHTRA